MVERILIVDDSQDVCWALCRLIQAEGWEAVVAETGQEAVAAIRQELPDLAILDMRLPDTDGFKLLKEFKTCDDDIPVIVITGYGDMQDAVRMVRAGACDYLSKPFDRDAVLLSIRRAMQESSLKREIMHLREKLDGKSPLSESMGNSKAVRAISHQVAQVARTGLSVLITGETGTGKELVSQAIHDASLRSGGPFMALDCGALPETLCERELFGHEKGAFTGADRSVPGAFELAEGGTLFLDEIGNLPMTIQSKLLRVLDERRIHRLGGTKNIAVDVRIIAATNDELSEKVERHLFRRDLYHRLAEFLIRVPPLRDRKDDLPFLVRRFLVLTNRELNKNIGGLTELAWEAIQSYDWPGNVRELRNVLRRAVLLAKDEEVISHLHLGLAALMLTPPENRNLPTSNDFAGVLAEIVDAATAGNFSLKDITHKVVVHVERELLARTMKATKNNKAQAARLLHVDYKTLFTKVRRYQIEQEDDTLHG